MRVIYSDDTDHADQIVLNESIEVRRLTSIIPVEYSPDDIEDTTTVMRIPRVRSYRMICRVPRRSSKRYGKKQQLLVDPCIVGEDM